MRSGQRAPIPRRRTREKAPSAGHGEAAAGSCLPHLDLRPGGDGAGARTFLPCEPRLAEAS